MNTFLSATALLIATQLPWQLDNIVHVHEASKTICPKALSLGQSSAGYIETQARQLGYEQWETLVLLQFCESYVTGLLDGVDQARTILGVKR